MMYFQIHNHLENMNDYYKSEINNEINNDCIICLEKTTNKLCKSSLTKVEEKLMKKICICECYVHENCLVLWLTKCEKCPICRNNFELVIVDEEFYLYYPVFLFLVYNYKNALRKFFTIIRNFIILSYVSCSLVFFIHIGMKVCIIILKNV